MVSSQLDEAQTAAAVEFIKYMTSPRWRPVLSKKASVWLQARLWIMTRWRILWKRRGKVLVEACRLCQNADYQALGLGNNFGDAEGEIQAKYAGLKDGSKTVESAVEELDAFLEAAE